MASVNERLGRLEAKATTPHEVPPELIQLCEAIEDWRREHIHGLPPVKRPYTAADRDDDIRFLEEVLPEYRANEGWQSEEAQDLLDAWEEKTRAKLEGANR